MIFRLPGLPGQKNDEKILLQLHRHWFVFFTKLLMIVAAAALPAVGMWMWIRTAHWILAPDTLGYAMIVMGASFFFLFMWLLLFGFWLDYALDFFVVTNKRVVDVEQSGLLDRTVSEQYLDKVQDVTHEIKGFWPTFLHYGNVYIQSAGQKERFIFEDVPNPDKVAMIILQNSEKAGIKINPSLNVEN